MHPEEIRKLREVLGFSQAELADAIGVNRSAVTHWESGYRNPSGPSKKMLEMLRKTRLSKKLPPTRKIFSKGY